MNNNVTLSVKQIFAFLAILALIITSSLFIGIQIGSNNVAAVPNGVDSAALPIIKGGTGGITPELARSASNLNVFSREETNTQISNTIKDLGNVTDLTPSVIAAAMGTANIASGVATSSATKIPPMGGNTWRFFTVHKDNSYIRIMIENDTKPDIAHGYATVSSTENFNWHYTGSSAFTQGTAATQSTGSTSYKYAKMHTLTNNIGGSIITDIPFTYSSSTPVEANGSIIKGTIRIRQGIPTGNIADDVFKMEISIEEGTIDSSFGVFLGVVKTTNHEYDYYLNINSVKGGESPQFAFGQPMMLERTNANVGQANLTYILNTSNALSLGRYLKFTFAV